MSSPAGQVPTSTTNPPKFHKAPSMKQPSIDETSIHGQPTRPPGLIPLHSGRLWRPHEDQYWTSIRNMWGSHIDLTGTHEENDRHGSSAPASHETSQYDPKKAIRDTDLCTENGAVFRIVLPNNAQKTAAEGDNNHVSAGRSSSERTTGAPRSSINHTPINDALALHLPPPALQKPNNSHSKGRRAFQGSTLNVTVVTTTRTYGDFSKMNPPPYTPRPTGRERSFGRSGKLATESKKARWPVAKWLFLLGFILPLLWLFGSCLLLSGMRRMGADAQMEEAQNATSKYDTHSYNTNTESVTHLIAQEVIWSKRCAWAFAGFACICFVVLGIFKGLGM